MPAAISSCADARIFHVSTDKTDTSEACFNVKRVALVAIAAMVSFVFYSLGAPLAASMLAGVAAAKVVSLWQDAHGPYSYMRYPHVTMREAPTQQSLIASQAIYGEKVQVHKSIWTLFPVPSSWSYITASDGYKGWVPTHALVSLDQPYLSANSVACVTNVGGGYIYSKKDTMYGHELVVPYKTQLRILDATDERWVKIALLDGKECYIQKGDIAREKPIENEQDLVAFSKKFLHSHYTFGGKSGWEYDCSGLTQMIYAAMGITIPRDSKDQIKDDQFEVVDPKKEALKIGDLVFWGGAADKIRHVGMFIGGNMFIHSAVTDNRPWVRIDNLDHPDWNGKNPLRPYRAFRRYSGHLYS